MKRNKTSIQYPADRRKVNRIYWLITIAIILAPFAFLVYKTIKPPVKAEIKSSYDGYIIKTEKKNITIKSPLLEEEFKMQNNKLANLNNSEYARKIKDSELSVKLTKEYHQKTLELKTRGLSTMQQVLYTNEKYTEALAQFRDSVKDYNLEREKIDHEIAQIELKRKALNINLPSNFKITVPEGSYVTKGQTIAIS
ncbi:MAG TPA: hypothetical protein QF753_15025 [Victivallales bacterium]|nr:hypothetical protein [Victivallales bacterium]